MFRSVFNSHVLLLRELHELGRAAAAGIVKAVGQALNKDPRIVIYSPEEVGTGKSGKAEGFPFR